LLPFTDNYCSGILRTHDRAEAPATRVAASGVLLVVHADAGRCHAPLAGRPDADHRHIPVSRPENPVGLVHAHARQVVGGQDLRPVLRHPQEGARVGHRRLPFDDDRLDPEARDLPGEAAGVRLLDAAPAAA